MRTLVVARVSCDLWSVAAKGRAVVRGDCPSERLGLEDLFELGFGLT